MSITTVICDLSEVLIPGIVGAESIIERRIGVPTSVFSTRWNQLNDDFCDVMRGRLGLQQFLENFVFHEDFDGVSPEYLDHLIQQNFLLDLEDSAFDIVSLLGEQYRLVLFSDHAQPWTGPIMAARPEIFEPFERIFFSHDLGMIKQDRLAFPKVLSMLPAKPENCLFIDDNMRNIHAAIKTGMSTILFGSSALLQAELELRGVFQ